MADIESALRSEFPEATEAEIKRFVASCRGPEKNKDADAVKEDAEKALEDYLDWRSCYGLDYKRENEVDVLDCDDWKFAIGKALEVSASTRRAKELEEKLAEERAKQAEEDSMPVNYDIDLSDSQKSEGDDNKEKGDAEQTTDKEEAKDDNGNERTTEISDDEKKKELSQIIFQHLDKDGNPIKDLQGSKILHVLPGLINRQVAQADFYAMALSFYLDRKLDRTSEEKMTVVVDVRAGDGWPNPAAFLMVKFTRTIMRQLQKRYPERLNSLILFPVPWAAMGVWAAIKHVFRLEIMDKITLISGPADRDAPLPSDKLTTLIDPEILNGMEQFRLDNFKPIV